MWEQIYNENINLYTSSKQEVFVVVVIKGLD